MSKNYNDVSGLLLLDKPLNITSFKVTHRIKKILNVEKTGHCGTLDPLATGLLLILVGKATKLQYKFMKEDKVYVSSFLLGVVTDTGDLGGKIIFKKNISSINFENVKKAIRLFKGEIFQIPPMYSALKNKGIKLYELARQGIEIERSPRKVVIKNFDLLSYGGNVARVRIECSTGTYIRSLARNLGDVLGCGATVKTLRREKIGVFNIKDALKFEYAEDVEAVKSRFINYEKLLEWLKNQ
ncbi:MAG: tRNA pseudouridine(55) synthase TruB [Endomicrobium sp.]|jgi:tRNA pseudouridine55 synthase|nr:tRNA pseudouridine(55) synthase TruB [Endomicrobium sp.]